MDEAVKVVELNGLTGEEINQMVKDLKLLNTINLRQDFKKKNLY